MATTDWDCFQIGLLKRFLTEWSDPSLTVAAMIVFTEITDQNLMRPGVPLYLPLFFTSLWTIDTESLMTDTFIFWEILYWVQLILLSIIALTDYGRWTNRVWLALLRWKENLNQNCSRQLFGLLNFS